METMKQEVIQPPPKTQGYTQHSYPQGPQPYHHHPPQPYHHHPPQPYHHHPPPTSYYPHPPPNHHYGYPSPYFYPSAPPNYYNPAPFPAGSTFNSGGNTNESGIQKNGDVNVGNSKEKSGGVDIGSIGGNHGNKGGQQSSGNITAGNIGC